MYLLKARTRCRIYSKFLEMPHILFLTDVPTTYASLTRWYTVKNYHDRGAQRSKRICSSKPLCASALQRISRREQRANGASSSAIIIGALFSIFRGAEKHKSPCELGCWTALPNDEPGIGKLSTSGPLREYYRPTSPLYCPLFLSRTGRAEFNVLNFAKFLFGVYADYTE